MNITIKYNSSKKAQTKILEIDGDGKFMSFEPVYFQPPKCEILNNALRCINQEKEEMFHNKYLEIEQVFLNEFEKQYPKSYLKLFQSKLNQNSVHINGTIEDYLECLCILKIDGIYFDLENNIFQLNVQVYTIIETKHQPKKLQDIFVFEESEISEEVDEEEIKELDKKIQENIQEEPNLQNLFVKE